jgi:large subunit ribosomal protein L9
VVKVSLGFAQNFLYPQKKAKPATSANLKFFEEEKARSSREEAVRLLQAQEQAARISAVRLRLEVSVGEGDKLFGSVTSQDIVDALSQQGIALDRKKLHLEEPIKRLGSYRIPFKVHPEVTTDLKLDVVKKS